MAKQTPGAQGAGELGELLILLWAPLKAVTARWAPGERPWSPSAPAALSARRPAQRCSRSHARPPPRAAHSPTGGGGGADTAHTPPCQRRLSKSYPSRRHSSNCLTEEGGRGKKKSNTQDAVGLGSPPPAPPPAVRSQAKFSRKGLVLEHDKNKQSRSDSLPCWKGVHPRPSPRWQITVIDPPVIPGARRDRADNKRSAARAGGAGRGCYSAPRGLPDTVALLRQRHLMEEVGTAQSFQVRPVQQLLGLLQEREQLSSSPGATRGTAPREGLAPLSPDPAGAPELSVLVPNSPALGSLAAALLRRGGKRWRGAAGSGRMEATRRAPSLAPRVFPLEQWDSTAARRPAGSPPRRKVPAADRRKCSPSAAAGRTSRRHLAESSPRGRPASPALRGAAPLARSHGAGSTPRAALYRAGLAAPPRPRPQRPEPAHWLRRRPPRPARPARHGLGTAPARPARPPRGGGCAAAPAMNESWGSAVAVGEAVHPARPRSAAPLPAPLPSPRSCCAEFVTQPWPVRVRRSTREKGEEGAGHGSSAVLPWVLAGERGDWNAAGCAWKCLGSFTEGLMWEREQGL